MPKTEIKAAGRTFLIDTNKRGEVSIIGEGVLHVRVLYSPEQTTLVMRPAKRAPLPSNPVVASLESVPPPPLREVSQEVLNIRLDDYKWPKHSQARALIATMVFRSPSRSLYLGELAQLTEKELRQMRNCGNVSLGHLKKVLGKQGLTLGMTFPNWKPPSDSGA